MTRIVIGKHIRNRAADVAEEALRDFEGFDDGAAVAREIRKQIVTATFPEFITEVWRPILESDLPTIYMQTGPGMNGRDAFQRVRHFAGRYGDAVERVAPVIKSA